MINRSAQRSRFPTLQARRSVHIALTAAVLSLASPHAGAAAPTTPLSAEQQTRAERIKDTLRCPICTGESINDSTNDISREMRGEVERMVAEGQTDREIYDFFSTRYGQFVLLDPPKQGVNLLLWAGPLLALGAGAWWLLSTLKTRPASAAAVNATEHGNDYSAEADLDPYLQRVQREVRRQPGQATKSEGERA